MKKIFSCTSFLCVILGGILAGCSNPEAAVIGDWKNTDATGGVMTFKADHTVSGGSGLSAMTGTWNLKDKSVTVKPQTIAGKPTAELEAQMDKVPPSMASNPQFKSQMDAVKKLIDSGVVYTVSDDGKKMTATVMGKTDTIAKVEAKS